MKNITVELGERSYPIFIGEGLLEQPDLLSQFIDGQKVCIVSNNLVADLYLEKVQAQLSRFQTSTFIIEDGEQFKSMDTLNNVLDHLLGQQVDRKSTLIALGGGVVGDLSGFAAASCLRGINFIQIPTTLLAQVDSSVGGKTGVNHTRGKNLIGAFYQPRCVLADLGTLDTLSDRDFSAGMAEVIKYGLIDDIEFFNWIESNHDQIRRKNKDCLSHVVARSCEIKADVVSKDETEQGLRAILNFGHTFGHAIEAATGYKSWLHGEAISAGMVMACEFSQMLGHIDSTDVERVKKLFSRFDLPINPPGELTAEQMKQLMLQDKKTLDSVIRLILLKKLGKAYVSDDYPEKLLLQLISQSLQS